MPRTLQEDVGAEQEHQPRVTTVDYSGLKSTLLIALALANLIKTHDLPVEEEELFELVDQVSNAMLALIFRDRDQ